MPHYSVQFTIGRADDLKLFLGLTGIGKNSFTAFRKHVLSPNESVHAVLRYQDAEGSFHEFPFDLMDRC